MLIEKVCKGLSMRLLAIFIFVLSNAVGNLAVTAFNLLHPLYQSNRSETKGNFVMDPCKSVVAGTGRSGNDRRITWNAGYVEPSKKTLPLGTKPLRIWSKPRPLYPERAKEKCIEGTVLLKVKFKADGSIGKISVKEGLPYGLSDSAVEAAKLMKFVPAEKDGKPVSVTKKIQYTFTIY